MRILQWVPLYLPEIGGIENTVYNLIRNLSPRGFEFVVVASHGPQVLPDRTEYDGVEVYRFHYRRALETGAVPQIIQVRKQIADLKRRFRPDIVHIHFSDPSFYFHLQTLQSHPSLTIVTLHNSLGHMGAGGEGTLVTQMLRTADWVTGVSERTLLDAVEVVPEIEDYSSVIYNGLPALDFEPRPLNFDEPRLLCVGRLAGQKGFDIAIDAVALMIERLPQVHLSIAGDGSDLENLRERVTRYGLENHVEFLGAVSPERVRRLMDASNIILMPSRFEGFPLVALEAAQVGRPIVASDVDGLAEAVVNGETGVLVQREDPHSLANAVISLLENPDHAHRLAALARETVEDKYTLQASLRAYEILYRRLVVRQES